MMIELIMLAAALLVHGEQDERVFLVSPQARISPLNTSATFTCIASADLVNDLLWEVNGGQISYPGHAEELRTQGFQWSSSQDSQNFTLQLTATATQENNETKIVCVAVTMTLAFIKTLPVIFTVYDRPCPPTNLSVSPLPPGRLALIWSEPYSHPNITLSYNINITQRNTQTVTTVWPSLSVTVTNTSVFLFTPVVQSCDEYLFTVSAVNEAGASEWSYTVTGSLPISPDMTNVSSSLSHTLAIDEEIIICTISFESARVCPDYLVTLYQLHLTNTASNNTTTHPLLPTPPHKLNLDSSDGLLTDAHYIYYITAENDAGTEQSTSREMVTTDVSHVTISLKCLVLNITCHFWSGSTALGCYISLTPKNAGKSNAINETISRSDISHEAMHTILLQVPYWYQLAIYDWENDGRLGHIPVPLASAEIRSENTSVTPNSNCGGSSWKHLVAILASAVGGFVILATILFLVGLGIHCHRKAKTASQANKHSNNPQPMPEWNWDQEQSVSSQDLPSSLPVPPPPIYDQPNILIDCNGESVRYSILTRGSSMSSTNTSHSPHSFYSKLYQLPEYATIGDESHTATSLPPALNATDDTERKKHFDFMNSLPSAGTTL